MQFELGKIRLLVDNPWISRQSVLTIMSQRPLNAIFAQLVAFKLHRRPGLTKAARQMLDGVYHNNFTLLTNYDPSATRNWSTVKDKNMGWSAFWRPTGTIPNLDQSLVKRTLMDFTSLLAADLVEVKDPQALIRTDNPRMLTPQNFRRDWTQHCTGSVVAGVITVRLRLEQLMYMMNPSSRLPTVWDLVAGPHRLQFARGVLLIFQLPLTGHSREHVQDLQDEHDAILIDLASHYITGAKRQL
jgi:hypothetical protein